jgi:hypothetical protein
MKNDTQNRLAARDRERQGRMANQIPKTIEEIVAIEEEAQQFFLEIRELQCGGAIPLYRCNYQWDSGYYELESLESYYDAQPL